MAEKYKGVKSSVKIDGIKVDTYKQEIINHNVIEVEAGTTGPQGGASSWGCRTIMKIKNLGCTDMRPTGYSDDYGHSEFSIVFGGDSELETFIEALEFTLDILNEQSKYRHTKSNKDRKKQEFYFYIKDVVDLYNRTGKLSGMGKIKNKYHVSAITKEQFFECHLNEVGDDSDLLSKDFTDKIYNYILDRKNILPIPIFKK